MLPGPPPLEKLRAALAKATKASMRDSRHAVHHLFDSLTVKTKQNKTKNKSVALEPWHASRAASKFQRRNQRTKVRMNHERGQGGRPQGQPMSTEMMLREADRIEGSSMVMFRAGGTFLKENKVFTGLWIAGLLLLQFAVGMSPSAQAMGAYDRAMDQLDDAAMQKALNREHSTYAQYRQAKGWFSCDATCTRLYGKYKKAAAISTKQKAIEKQMISDAKANVGAVSTYAVEEVRGLWKRSFARGKAYAKRASWYDVLFGGIGFAMGRDENMGSFVIRIVFQMVINFVVGLFGAFIGFLWYLGGIIWSYQPVRVNSATPFRVDNCPPPCCVPFARSPLLLFFSTRSPLCRAQLSSF